MANYSKDEILEKYGINEEMLDKILTFLDLLDYFNNVGKRNRFNESDQKDLNAIINAKPEVNPVIGKFSRSKKYVEKMETSAITKITFKIGKEKYSITNELFIEIVRKSLANYYVPNPITANIPKNLGRELLRRSIIDFIRMRGNVNENEHQQFKDAGNFLADIGYLKDADEWDKDPGNYVSHNEYLVSRVKRLINKQYEKP